MIYFVTCQQSLCSSDVYKTITVNESLAMMKDWKVVQYDSETNGRDAHINKVLCAQFGNDAADARIVVDTSTVDLKLYKDILETKTVIGQNLKFDLAFLYNYHIIPRNVYDTMIVEQLLHLGYPPGVLSYSLKSIANRRLNIDIDKTIRGEIIWRGLDTSVVMYAAGDVTYLEQIAKSQIVDLKKQGLLKAAQIECAFVPVITYLEWCGIHLDSNKWKEKMKQDLAGLEESKKKLNAFAVTNPKLSKYTYVNRQGDLFSGFDLTPKCTINWSSSRQVVNVAKDLGFDTTVKDKETGEDKDSVLEKHLKSQKGISDEFLKLYFDYQGKTKVVTSFGQGHLNVINPITDRIHTVYKQLGCASGRMSCGSQQSNRDLAQFKKIYPKACTYPNIQQLPADEETRSCFTAPKGYKWCSCDFSSLESRLGADIYNEKEMLNEYLHGSGDMHSLMAIVFFGDQMEEGITTKEVKKKYPHFRKEAKSPEFLIQFGGSAFGLAQQLGVPEKIAQSYVDKYYGRFKGIAKFKAEGSRFVREKGYILMCKYSGHKMYWYDHKEWLERQKSYTPAFWKDYSINHKGTGDAVAKEVSKHSRAASKWDRLALNSVTQGSGIVILKIAMTNFFNWIVDKGYFGIVELAALVHDESNVIYPENLTEVPIMQKKFMEEAASIICKKLPIPAELAVGDCWIH